MRDSQTGSVDRVLRAQTDLSGGCGVDVSNRRVAPEVSVCREPDAAQSAPQRGAVGRPQAFAG